MANKILPKFETEGAFTISLASLASSTSGVGRQSTMIDNTVTRYRRVHVYGWIKQGTSPTSAKGVYVYVLRGDLNATPYRTDNAGASDAGLTVLNAPIGVAVGNKASGAATGDLIPVDLIIEDPGPEFGICVVHDTVAALDSTGGNHVLRYIGEELEIQ